MSRQTVETVRRIVDLFNARKIDEALQGVAEDFEMDWSNSIGPLKGIYRGREGVLELWKAFLEAWESVRWDPQEIIDVDDQRVILVNRVYLKGRGSGVEVDATGVQIWTLKDGKAERIKLYQSRSEALEAEGLRE
jgi:ketosteroid isomerase-like protein